MRAARRVIGDRQSGCPAPGCRRHKRDANGAVASCWYGAPASVRLLEVPFVGPGDADAGDA